MNSHKLLIVDDDPAAIMLSKVAILKVRTDCSIVEATCGNQALACLNNGTLPDLILLDLKLSGMDGIEILQQIRAREDCRTIPIIILSSSKLENDLLAAYNAGANDYLYKEYCFSTFVENLNAAIHFWIDVNVLPNHYDKNAV
jgi:CheY-like chemotaxis protein